MQRIEITDFLRGRITILPRGVIVAASVLILAILPWIIPTNIFLLHFVTRVMIFGIAAMSLDLILGYGGMISFGHAVYLGIGGYAVAVLSRYGVDNGWLQFPLAVLGSGLVALPVGLIALRTSGAYFIMITLGLAQMFFYIGSGIGQFGGDDGFSTKRSIFASDLALSSPLALYLFTFALFVAILIGMHRLVNSRFGIVLQGIKSNERRTRALGFSTIRYKLVAFVIAGMICGVAGALYVNLEGYMTPGYMNWVQSGDLIVMLLIGGQQTIIGGVIGAAVFQGMVMLLPDLIEAVLPGQGQNWPVLFGPFLILLVLYFKGGLVNAIPVRWSSGE